VRVVSGVEVTEERSVSEFYAGIPRLFASIHCVGGFAAAPLVETSFDAFSRLMAGNAASCFLCTREAVRRMAGAPDSGAGRGRIVNVAAQQALDPRKGAGMAAYAASKAAVAALTQAIAEEVASQGIFVNAVAPSILDTPANRKAMPDADPSRWPKVEEVAATIAFLASPQNLSARGGVVPVYGRT
jgi:NAD(P)-dependent dehydrogenase (short-subunit alcohol dehydrogenase family)